jgi:hypothetical protein
VQAPKPAPDIFLQAAGSLEQDIQSCLVVEDSLIGLLAAKNANIFSVLVPSISVNECMQKSAGIILNDLSELSVNKIFLRENYHPKFALILALSARKISPTPAYKTHHLTDSLKRLPLAAKPENK